MKPLSVSKVNEIVKGTLVTGFGDQLILDAETRIRRITKPNMLTFVGRNEKPDWERIKMYSPCTIIASKFYEEYKSIDNCAVILVNNVRKAYWSFVRYYRKPFNIPVIAVTGTSGKTTTKEMIKLILSRYMKISATVGNSNGCARSLHYLLTMDETTQAAVFETAVGAPGEVEYACEHFKPTIGIITNIGAYHLDTCRTVKNYIKAKAEMVSALDDKGILILNSDDENTKKINLKDFKGRIVYFGVKHKADYHASNIKYYNHTMEFMMTFKNVNYPVSVQGYGDHQVYNALAALASVQQLGIDVKEAAKILASYKDQRKRLEVHKGINGSLIVDDTWNHNLFGLTAGLKALVYNIAPGKKKVVMLGGYDKLGEHSEEIIGGVGNLIADLGIDNIIIIGGTAEAVANAVRKRGGCTKINICNDSSQVYTLLNELLDENTAVFVKCYRNEYSAPILENLEKIIVE